VGNKIFGVNLSQFLSSFPSFLLLTVQILSYLIFIFFSLYGAVQNYFYAFLM
jgi:hypothetical protein